MQRFNGDLQKIDPQLLVSISEDKPLDGFFLVMSTIFNDLKGLIFFQVLLNRNYDKPEDEAVSVHLGEYSGLIIQLRKLTASLVNEFFAFIKENKSLLSNIELQLMIKKMSPEARNNWQDIVGVSLNEGQNISDFAKALLKIRNNVGFHYDQSCKNLKKSFISNFNQKKKTELNSKAYYMVGSTMETTRFFYADAAVGEYLSATAGEIDGSGMSLTDFLTKELDVTCTKMNMAISELVILYIKKRQGGK